MRRLDRRNAGFEERDMMLYVITPSSAQRDGQALSKAERDALLRAVDADPTKPELILVGKDGGVKMRASLNTSLDRIFQRIDQMPMRQREMRGTP